MYKIMNNGVPIFPLKTFLVVLLVSVIVIPGTSACGRHERIQPLASKGVLDLSGWDLERDGPIDLKGEWAFHWNALIPPGEFLSPNPPQPSGFIKVPGAWNNFTLNDKKTGLDGYATYRLTVITGPQRERLALKIGDVNTSYRLFIDGTLISSVGNVGTSKEQQHPAYKIQVVSFPGAHDRIEILFHVANYYFIQSGITRYVMLGTEQGLGRTREMKLLLEFFSIGILFIMFFYPLSFFFLLKNDRIPLLFALVCFFTALRIINLGERFILDLFPEIDFQIWMIYNLSLNFVSVIFFVLYLYELYKDFVSKKAINFLLMIFISVIVAYILLPFKIATSIGNNYASIPGGIAILYVLYVAVRLMLQKRRGSVLFFAGALTVIIFACLEILYAGLVITTEFRLYQGFLLFTIIQAFALAKRYSDAFDENLNLKNELERKVEERTRELSDALDEVGVINDRLSEVNAKLEGFGTALKRYLPIQLVNSILSGVKSRGSDTERRKITMLFSDIKDFTDTTDSLEAEELSALLNEYLTEMTKIAHRYDGTIDKFIGDAIVIFFGAPESMGEKEDAIRCVRMAVEMQARMKELREKWFNQGIERPLQIRIGINTGVATVGDFGAEDRLSYTAIGGQVNLASRLEGLCEPEGILISHSTWALVKDEFECRSCGEKQVKGIHHDVLVYEVILNL